MVYSLINGVVKGRLHLFCLFAAVGSVMFLSCYNVKRFNPYKGILVLSKISGSQIKKIHNSPHANFKCLAAFLQSLKFVHHNYEINVPYCEK